MIVNRIAAMALMFTGLSREAARFQARSAFTGCGFTTHEAEGIVNHPVRRQIVMILMLLGNIGIATVIATIMISVSSTSSASSGSQVLTLTVLTLGLFGMWLFFSSRYVERQLNKVIAWALTQFTDLNVRDYVSLLNLANGYSVSEILLEPKHWVTGQSLKDLRLADEGILIMAIQRSSGGYRGIPRANDVLNSGDTLILYGKLENIRALDLRKLGKSGDKQHEDAVERQSQIEVVESMQESA